mgnify:FL=1|tara:strand:+ start:1635 stop:2309 length:675 start_codon:yes stop_codon:yes gene_type:complete
MSLIDQIAENGKNKLKMHEAAGTKQAPPKMIKSTDFMSIVREVYESRSLDKKSKKEFKDYRTRLRKAEWPLEGVMGHVDQKAWKEICEDTITYMVKNIRNSQPNGEWVLMEYEADIRMNKNNQETIVIACKFVDSENGQELRYTNGVPALDVNINVADNNKELVEAITKKTEASGDEELKDLMKQFIQVMAADMVNKKTAQAEPKPTPEPQQDDVDDLADGFEG